MSKSARRPSPRTALTAHYVASTHWDREWYESFQHYRFRLVDVIDAAIELLERDPDYRTYQLDGQAVVLEDYFAIRPERRERFQALVDAGRIQSGPWYVMPDEFLPCGESLVRNLLRGHQVVEPFGPPMKVGFICDIFGHNSQLPQIFRGFGIDSAVLWRGTNYPDVKGLFRWQGADGSEVLTYAFEDRGYGQYQFEVRKPARTPSGKLNLNRAVDGLRNILKIESSRTPGKALLFFDGIDHIPPEPATSKLLAKARASRINVVHSTLPDFFEAVRAQKLKLQRVRGELREPGVSGGELIPGVLSSRIYLKQANARCESRLLHWAEPFGAFASLVGADFPAGFLNLAWQYLLRNHPHDSICGCSIDQVHRDMVHRFDQCGLIADRACQMSLRAIADRTPLPKLEGKEDFVVTVFNPNAVPLDGVVDLPLHFPVDTENRFQEWFGYEPIVGFRLYDVDDNEIPYQRMDVTKRVAVKAYDRLADYTGSAQEQVRVATRLNIPPQGWTTLVCKPTRDRTRSVGSQLVDDHTMQNDLLHVCINPNGTVDVTDRKGGQTYRNALTFEERADIGDGWYHGTAVNDEILSSSGAAADIALVHDGFALTTFRVRTVMNVPACFMHDPRIMRRSDELVPLAITSWITLRAGSPLLEVHTEVDNTARDHRLRVLFPTDLDVDTWFADSPFDVIERSVTLRADSHELYEQEVETKPQHSFIAVNDGKHGLAVISCGQPEAAVRDLSERPIALTLFRGFARTVATMGEPEGQMLGTTTHDYWLYPHRGPLPTTELFQLGQRLAAGVECISTDLKRQKLLRGKPSLPATGSWFTLDRGPLVISACKRSEDGQAIIIRLFNPTDETTRQRLAFMTRPKSAHTADMLEQPQDQLTLRRDAVTVQAAPKEIVTLRIVPNSTS